jgi:hypothetical protein
MKYLSLIVIFMIANISYAEPMKPLGSMKNQNIDIRLSDNNVTFNYDFLIPKQRVFMFNQFSYNEEEPGRVLHATTGVILKEPTELGFKLSLGLTLSYLNAQNQDTDGVYMSILAGAQDLNVAPNTLYYKAQVSVSPNIITFGDLSNVYNGSAEVGLHVTYGAVLFAGYKHLKVESPDISDSELLSHPYIGMSLKF